MRRFYYDAKGRKRLQAEPYETPLGIEGAPDKFFPVVDTDMSSDDEEQPVQPPQNPASRTNGNVNATLFRSDLRSSKSTPSPVSTTPPEPEGVAAPRDSAPTASTDSHGCAPVGNVVLFPPVVDEKSSSSDKIADSEEAVCKAGTTSGQAGGQPSQSDADWGSGGSGTRTTSASAFIEEIRKALAGRLDMYAYGDKHVSQQYGLGTPTLDHPAIVLLQKVLKSDPSLETSIQVRGVTHGISG